MRNDHGVIVAVFKAGRAVAPCYPVTPEIHDIHGGNVGEVGGARLAVTVHAQRAVRHAHNCVRTADRTKPRHFYSGVLIVITSRQIERPVAARYIRAAFERLVNHRLHILVQHDIGSAAGAAGNG